MGDGFACANTRAAAHDLESFPCREISLRMGDGFACANTHAKQHTKMACRSYMTTFTVFAGMTAALAAAVLAACDSSNDAGGGRGNDGGALETSSEGGDPSDASAEADAAPDETCPSAAPSQDALCATQDLICSWGTDSRFGCRTVAVCRDQRWQLFSGACSAPPPACPPTAPSPDDGGGASCTQDQYGLTCAYSGTAYTCTACMGNLCIGGRDGGYDFHWFRTKLEQGCPQGAIPNFGDPCSTPSLACDYNHCANNSIPGVQTPAPWARGVGLVCNGQQWGNWSVQTACP